MRFGTITIVGHSNVGKSTFLNAALGEHLAIVSRLPQTTRDVLLAHVPMILRTDFYATAAILGSVTILLARRCGLSPRIACGAGGLICFAARLVGAFNHWHLPVFQ